MFLTEQNGAQMWSKMLKENFDVKDNEKLNWVSQYAAIHEIHESALGVNAGHMGMQVPGTNVNPLYATPLNTIGMGNPYAPQNVNTMSTAPAADGNLWNQTVGSGDIPVSTLPMALNIALMTIGLELVPVVPAKGPWVMLSYMDFPYAGGKLGRVNETAFDGKGEKGSGNDNKPIYVKIQNLPLAKIADLRAGGDAKNPDPTKAPKAGQLVEVNGIAIGTFLDFGRMDGAPLVKVWDIKEDGTACAPFDNETKEVIEALKNYNDKKWNMSLREIFENVEEDAAPTVKIGNVTVKSQIDGDPDADPAIPATPVKIRPDFVQTAVDLVDGFANFATGKKEAMTRAQNETGTGNVIGLRLFSKWVQVGAYEVTGTVTRQQLQDLPLYGVDAVGKVMEALQNEITQHINQRILERVFALGVTNAAQQKVYQGVDLNLWMGTVDKALADFVPAGKYVDIYGVDQAANWGKVINSEVNTSAENLATRQRRIASRVLAAANLIQTVGRRGRATWIVTNTMVATALQDVSGYVVAPMVNNMAQDGSQNLYLGGTLAGLKVYVDPYMNWDDCRICVGRKGDANSPGVVFMPYILADTVSITAEGTMAPKMLVNSRYAIAEIGFYPETQYYTFCVGSEFGLI